MARLGELLVATGLLTADQVEQALRAQVMWGGRLGTNLIELGYLDLDTLSSALGRQHRLPAALSRHFDKADPELQKRLDPDVAERYSVVPIRASGPSKLVVFAAVTPIDKRGQAIIADELGVTVDQLIPSIAAELRIRYHLERVYKIPRGTRFLRARGASIPPFPQFEIAPVHFDDISEVNIPLPAQTSELPLVPPEDLEPVVEVRADTEEDLQDLQDYSALALLEEPADAYDDLEVAHEDDGHDRADTLEEPTGRERRRYVRTIADEPSTDSERQALGRIAIRKVAAPAAVGTTLGEATRAIRRGTDRDKVGELIVTTLERFLLECEAAALLVVRGEVAIGWKGFCRSGAAMPEIGVPIDQGGMVPRAMNRGATVRSPATDLGPIDQLLAESLGGAEGDLAVVPVAIGGQVMCLIALVVTPNTPVATAESIAAAAGAAFARLMRHAAR